jgi:pimeloyl-ACP methyl ester carboxylesterase
VYGYVSVEHGQVHFSSDGNGRDTLCLFHETPVDVEYFSRCAPLLSRHFRVVAFDTPGYGRSTPSNGQTSIESYAATLWQAIGQLGLQRIAIAGVHTGAAICVELMRRHPQSIIAAVLSGVPLLDHGQQEKLRHHVAQRTARLDAEALRALWRDRKARWVDAPDSLLIEAMASELHVFDRRDRGLTAVADYDMAAALSSCRSPVLILNGRKDSLIGADEAVAVQFPQFALKILEARGGQLPWTAAAEYCEELRAFLIPRCAAAAVK